MGLFDRIYEGGPAQQQMTEAERRERRAAQTQEREESRIRKERRQALYEQELLSQIRGLTEQNAEMAGTIRKLHTQIEILKQKTLEASDRETARELRQQEEKNGLVTALDQAVEELRAEHDASRDAMANTTLEVKSDVVSMAEQMERTAKELKTSGGENREALMQALEALSDSLREFLSQEAQGRNEELTASVAKLMEQNRAAMERTGTGLSTKIDSVNDGIQERLTESGKEIRTELSSKIDSIHDGIREELTESGKRIQSELSDRIHEESVKNYRNVQAMVGDEIEKLKNAELNDSSVEKIQKSFRGLKAFSIISFCGIAAILVFILCVHFLHL